MALASLSDAHLAPPAPAVQHECIPQAIMGNDVLCQAKSGMGKTAVFVISILQQIKVQDDKPEVLALVLCHTRELAYQVGPARGRGRRRASIDCARLVLWSMASVNSRAPCSAGMSRCYTSRSAVSKSPQVQGAERQPPEHQALRLITLTAPHQICHEFTRFAEFMPNVKVGNYFGGLDIKKQRAELKDHTPAIVVGTPGRIKQVRDGVALAEGRCCACRRGWAGLKGPHEAHWFF
jgi:hypothetical protein